MRDLDEQCQKLAVEKDQIKKELVKKNVLDDEEQRSRLIERIQQIYGKIDSLTDEKIELTEKLFYMHENFIRKLDQQIEKTEEDKNVQEKFNQDQQMEDTDIMQHQFKQGAIKSKRNQKLLGLTSSGLSSSFTLGGIGKVDSMSQSFGASLESTALGGSSIMGGSLKRSQKNDPFKYESSFPSGSIAGTGLPKSQKRDRNRDKKFPMGGGGFESSHQSSFNLPSKRSNQMANSNYIPFSQDENLSENQEREDEDDSVCAICNQKSLIDNWIGCDTCQKWFHQQCVGISQENLPTEDEQWFCQNCRDKPYGNLKMNRNFSEFGGGNNILDDD